MKNTFKNYFSTTNFDIDEPRFGHLERFEKRLQVPKKKNLSFRWIGVAASVLLIIGFLFGTNFKENKIMLADVSPQMQEAENFFVSTITQEIREIEKFRNPKTERVIEDALNQLEVLEKKYKVLIKELTKSNKDKRVIYAMISNYQSRIEVLQNVLQQIEKINKSKNIENDEAYL